MADKVQCAACQHFVQNPINPDAGMGWCKIKHSGMFPLASHYCRKFEGKEKDDARRVE